jgi:hypothetical protein
MPREARPGEFRLSLPPPAGLGMYTSCWRNYIRRLRATGTQGKRLKSLGSRFSLGYLGSRAPRRGTQAQPRSLHARRKVNVGMAQRPSPEGRLNRVLARAQELAEQVRETAERVHQQARESRRLIDIARQQTERGRELSKTGRQEARAVIESLKWRANTDGNGKHRQSRDGET